MGMSESDTLIEDLKLAHIEGEDVPTVPLSVVQYMLRNKCSLVEAYCHYFGKDVHLIMKEFDMTLEEFLETKLDPALCYEIAKSIDSSLTMLHLAVVS